MAKKTQTTQTPDDLFADMRKKLESLKGDVEIYDRETEFGTMKACKHVLNGKTYVHTEIKSSQLEEIGEMLIESDIFSIVKAEGDGVTVDAGTFISHLVKKKLMRRLLVILLRHEDGTATTAEEFESRASEFLRFVKEVLAAFFTLNPSASSDIGMFLIGVYGASTVGGQLIAMALHGRS